MYFVEKTVDDRFSDGQRVKWLIIRDNFSTDGQIVQFISAKAPFFLLFLNLSVTWRGGGGAKTPDL